MSYTVYKHTSPSGKVYIGITRQNVKKRWQNGNGYAHSEHFKNAILKYGWNNIKHEILYTGLSKDEACKMEIELIALYKSNQREFGYNNSKGGECGNKFSEETKQKISNSLKGKKASDATRKKLSDSHKGHNPWNKGIKMQQYQHYPKGVKHHSEQTRKKISEILKGKYLGSERYNARSVNQFTKDKIFVQQWKSISDASRSLNVTHNNITKCCQGQTKTAYGYIWEYADTESKNTALGGVTRDI